MQRKFEVKKESDHIQFSWWNMSSDGEILPKRKKRGAEVGQLKVLALLASYKLNPSVKFFIFALLKTDDRLNVTSYPKRSAYEEIGFKTVRFSLR